MSTTLRAQFSNRFAASEVWNLLFPKGTWHGENLRPIGGSITIDDAMLSEMVANWRAAGAPPLPVYKTHGHLDADVSALERAELSKAYGYLTDFRVTAAGLEAKTEWTPAGKRMVDEGEFAFWSPEWQPQHRDRRTGDLKGWWLSGTALCSNPFFQEMPPVAAATNPTEQPAAQEQHPMNEEQLKALRAKLGLAAGATVEEVLAAAEKRTNDVATLTAQAAKAPDTKALVAEAVKAAVEPMVAELAATKKALLEKEVDSLIASAKRGDGKNGRALVDEKVRPVLLKLVAAESSQAEGLKAAAAYLEAIPCTVPVVAAGVPGVATDESPKSAHEKLLAAADANAKAGLTGSAAMEKALRDFPELATKARSLTLVSNKEI